MGESLKTGCADTSFVNPCQGDRTVSLHFEGWCGRQCRHPSLGYLSPAAFEQRYTAEMKTGW